MRTLCGKARHADPPVAQPAGHGLRHLRRGAGSVADGAPAQGGTVARDAQSAAGHRAVSAVTYHAYHIGNAADRDRLLAEGWTVLGAYAPLSPILDVAVWLRCPVTCCPVPDSEAPSPP